MKALPPDSLPIFVLIAMRLPEDPIPVRPNLGPPEDVAESVPLNMFLPYGFLLIELKYVMK